MSKSINIFSKALEYYDMHKEKYFEINNKIKFIKFIKAKNDYEHNLIEFYDENKNKILSSRYEIMGYFKKKSNNWKWAWANTRLNPNTIFLSKKILNYGLDLESTPENMFIKNELITGEFNVKNKLQIELHISIASYLSKKPFIFNYKYFQDVNNTNQEFINIIFDKEFIKENNYDEYYLFILDFEKII